MTSYDTLLYVFAVAERICNSLEITETELVHGSGAKFEPYSVVGV